MYTRQNVDLCCQRTDLGDTAAIRTLVIFEDHLADSLLLVLIYSLTQNSQPLLVISECLFQALGDCADILFSLLFLVCKYSLFHLFLRNQLTNRCKQLFRNCTALVGMFRLAALSYDSVDEFDDLLVYFVCLEDRVDHDVLRNFLCASLDHDNLLAGGSNGQSHIRYFLLCIGRVYDKLAVDHADLGGRTRTIKRDIGNAGCDCRA